MRWDEEEDGLAGSSKELGVIVLYAVVGSLLSFPIKPLILEDGHLRKMLFQHRDQPM